MPILTTSLLLVQKWKYIFVQSSFIIKPQEICNLNHGNKSMGLIVNGLTTIRAVTFNTNKSLAPPIVFLEIAQVPIGLMLFEIFHYTKFGNRAT